MKKTAIIVGASLLLLNILCALVFTGYEAVPCVLSSLSIVVTTAFLVIARSITMKDAFYVTLSFVYVICGIIGFVMGMCSPQTFENNPCVIVGAVLLITQGLLTYIFHQVSQNNN